MLRILHVPVVASPALAALLLSTLALAAPAFAQGAPAAAPPAAQFGEIVEVRVVNIEVVVTDRDGVPVLGLSGDDFVLEVDGEAVPIEYFTEVRGGLGVEPSARAAGAEIPSIPGLAPGSPVGSSYLLFIDEFFSINRDIRRVLESLEASLELMRPNDRMAIVAYNGKQLEMLSSWTSSTAELRRAIEAAKERPAQGLQRLIERRQLDYDVILETTGRLLGEGVLEVDPTDLSARLSPLERFYVQRLAEQVQRSVEAAAATLRSFARPPGRKVMLLLSGGWPFLPAEFLVSDRAAFILDQDYGSGPALFRPLTDTANLLGYTLYPVDVPGLNMEVIDVERQSAAVGRDLDRRNSLREQEQHFTLNFLARETGGKAFLNAARLEAFESAVSDTRSYYWLGFTPQRGWDDRRHKVEVRLKNPGFRTRARSGFLDSSRQREVSMAVESALLFGDAAGTDALRLELGEASRSGLRRVEVPLSVFIPLDQVTFLPAGEGWRAQLELRVAMLDEAGGRSEIPVVPISLESPRQPQAGEVGRYRTALQLRRTRQQGIVAVYDPAGGRILSTGFDFEP